jgi:glycosyltransferase involved in cell wall biosynthesis
MRLLTVIPSYWPAVQFGGPIFSVHNINKALVRKSIDVTAYTTNVGLDSNIPVNTEITLDGVKITYFSYTKFFDFLGTTGWHFSLPMTKALEKTVINFDIIYVVAMWNYPIAVAAHFCRKYRKPYIISPRGLLYPDTFQNKLWKKFLYFQSIAKRDLNHASAIHYTTLDELENCHSSLGLTNEALVIPNGVDLSEFKNQGKKDAFTQRYNHLNGKKIITFVGRINWKKGLDILIRAYGLLLQQRNDVHLLIVGNDDEGYGQKIKRLITDAGLEYLDLDFDNKNSAKRSYTNKSIQELKFVQVTFTGMLEGKQKLEALSCSDVFVLASYSENFGMAVIEAMACGVPVVISNKVGIHRDVENNQAGIVVENNPQDLYKGIEAVLDNDNLRNEITVNAKRLVKESYDIDRVSSMVIEAFDNVIKNGNRNTAVNIC